MKFKEKQKNIHNYQGVTALKNKSKLQKWTTGDKVNLCIMFFPFISLFFLFTIIPVVSSVILSFFNYDMVNAPKFIGLDNYFRMFLDDEVFIISLKNTLKLSVVTGPLGFMLSFVLAWMINELSPGARSVLSFLFYSPALMGNVYFIWQIMFSGDTYGYVNSLLLSMNLISEPIQWFKNANYALPLVMIVQLWMSMGVSFLANIAGLQNVSSTLYEAGAIDGIKNRWSELWYITLPTMKSILLFSAVMQIQTSFSISAVATALTGFPSVNYSTETIVTHMTDVATIRFELGYAAAISVFLFLLMAIVRIVVGKLLNSTGK